MLVRPYLNTVAVSATHLFAKRLSPSSEQTLLSFHQISPVSLVSHSIETGFQRSLLGSLRFDHTMAAQSSKGSIHDFTVKDARENDFDLSIYKGKVLLIVNVASQCGLTNSNYTELSQVYEKYKDQGFEILAFPCNQFAGQEPGNNEQILEFACTRFKAEYPIFDKIEVNGDNASPLFKYLKLGKWGIFGDDIQWNFASSLLPHHFST